MEGIMTIAFGTLKKSARPIFVAAALAAAATLPMNAVQAADSAGKVLFILDASGSMWSKVEGQEKITIAKQVMTDLLRQLPDGIEAGLEVYGHRSKGACGDIEIMSAPARGNREAMIGEISSISPKGMTPITGSLRVAAEALKGTEEQASIVLVSDGKETCEADPCAAVRSIRAQGINLRIHVVGFDVNDEERKQLQCIAAAGGGKYFSADTAGQLATALSEVRQAVTTAPAETATKKKTIKIALTATVTSKNGVGTLFIIDPQSGSTLTSMNGDGGSLELPAGTYGLRYDQIDAGTVEIKAGDAVTLDANERTARVTTRNGVGTLFIRDAKSGATLTSVNADGGRLQLPAGTYGLRYDQVDAGTIEIKAGVAVTLDANERTAQVTTRNGVGTLFILDLQSAQTLASVNADGGRLQLPAGTYGLRYDQVDAGTIEIKAGGAVTLDAHALTATLTSRHGVGTLFILDAQSGQTLASTNAAGGTVQVPPGAYKLRYGQVDAGTIEVAAGDDIELQ
jgi:Mg-chelatase subunit ChlD